MEVDSVEVIEHVHVHETVVENVHETVTESHTFEVEITQVNGHDDKPESESEDGEADTSLQRSDSEDSLYASTTGMYEIMPESEASAVPCDLSEKVILIIGPLSAVGEAFTTALLKNKAKVILMNVKDEQYGKFVQSLTKQFIVASIECDIFDDSSLEDGLKQSVKVYGSLDIIINTTSYVDAVNWRKVIDVNLTFAVSLTELVLDHFGRDNGGCGVTLVQTSSYVGLYPNGSMPAYSASKAALIHYVKSYGRKEVYDMHGINMCCLCPAMVGRRNEKRSTLLDPEVVGKCLIEILESNRNFYGGVIKITSEKPLYL